MKTKDAVLSDFRANIADLLNLAMEELTGEDKISLAQILGKNPSALRIHVCLEPFAVVGAVFPPDKSAPPVRLFEIHAAASGATN